MIEAFEVERMVDRLIRREGGFVDHEDDAGGCTKYGITRPTLEAFRRKDVTCSDVEALSTAEAGEIYQAYWFDHRRFRLRQWPYRRLAEVALDGAVMFSLGRSMSVRWVQESINDFGFGGKLKVDGWAGEQTLAAMVLCDEFRLVAGLVARRCRKHARVVERVPGQSVFLEGWVNRATSWLVPGGHP